MAKKKSRSREARQRRQKQRQQNRRMLLLIALVVVAVVAVAVLIVSNQPVEIFIAEDLSARYAGITRSFSPEGYPRLGDPNAPVTLEEYSSFACPGCEVFHSDGFTAVLDYARSGQTVFTFVPLQTGSVPNAQGAARAALCAGQQGMFWEMHDVLFDWQTRYGNTAFSQNRLLAGVEQLGLSSAAFTQCFNSAAISETLDAAVGEDVATTPTIRVNGVTLEAGQAVPSAALIQQAIDEATPADWGLPAPVEDAPADSEEETTEADSTEAEETAEDAPADGEEETAADSTEAEEVAEDVPAPADNEDETDSTEAEEVAEDAPADGEEETAADSTEAEEVAEDAPADGEEEADSDSAEADGG